MALIFKSIKTLVHQGAEENRHASLAFAQCSRVEDGTSSLLQSKAIKEKTMIVIVIEMPGIRGADQSTQRREMPLKEKIYED